MLLINKMEFRKEKTEKSKELIRKHFQSDILNISSGYYKTEKILPVTPKPNERRDKMKEFIPKYKEMKPSIRLFNDLLSHNQKYNINVSDIKPNLTRQNSEVQILRGYTKIIKDNCFDEKGNFSSRKRYRLEFFGKDNINKTFNRSFSQSIKEKRNTSNKKLFNNHSLYKQKTLNNIRRINSYRNLFPIENKNIKKIEKTPKKNIKNNYNFKSPEYETNKIKDKINFAKIDNNKINQSTNKKLTNEKKNYFHPKDLNKVFYTKRDEPIKSNRITKRDNDEKEYFNIEIKNVDNSNNEPIVDQKKLKQIFLKNGLHLYDFNDDGMNALFKDKKIEAKLRKNKKDENFDKNYRNVVRELNKINVKVNRCGMINDTGFINNNAQRKRKGTPGKNLKKNNTNINYGIKRDKGIQPQKNPDYKNVYKYNLNYFNHKKK